MTDISEIKKALKSADDETRRAAVSDLYRLNSSDSIDLLLYAMGDDSWRVRKEAVEVFISIKPDSDAISKLLGQLKNEDNAGLRNSAAESAIRLGDLCADGLIALLSDNDPDIRKFAIDIMGAIGDVKFIQALLTALEDKDVNVASAAAEQLGALASSQTAEPLLQAIMNREDAIFRFSALDALKKIGCPIPVTESFLDLADQSIFKKSVFECLGAIGDESCLTLLFDGFSATQQKCRAAALKAVYSIYQRTSKAVQNEILEAMQLLKESELVDRLVGLSADDDIHLMKALIWAGDLIRDSRFIPSLIQFYSCEITASLALSALKNLGRDALVEIIDRYSVLDETGRSGLCFLIADCGYINFSDVIKKAVSDNSPNVRRSALHAVGKLGLVTLIPDVIKLINDNHVHTEAVKCLQSLIILNRTSIAEEMKQFCVSKLVRERMAAAVLLASLGERDSLLLLLKDEEPLVRKSAVTAIASYHIESYTSALVLALNDENPDVRLAVAEALGALKESSAVDILEKALDDTDIWVQSAVLKSIAKIDFDRAFNIIKNRYSTIDGLLMLTSLQIIESASGPEVSEIMNHALKSCDADVVRLAKRSLNLLNSSQNQ